MRDKKGIIDVTGEKAGNKPKKPYRAEAAATTKQRMRITYGLTEGTALGFGRNFTESDMLKRIFLDGTPIMSLEGDKLLDVIVEFRNGSRDQPVISGLPSVTVENEVNVEVTQGSPVSRSFNRIENTSYDIRVSVPQLFDGDDQGNQRKGLIQFKVEVSTGGGTFAPAGTFEIKERIVNGWSQTYNIKVASAAQHTIRISRLNSENVNEFSANTLVVESIVEITDVKLTYPNTALLYLEYDAEQFSNIPKLEVRLFGKSDILIPANYNPVTRSYSTTGTGTTGGVWNGSFKRDYTDNPVWIWLDLVVSKRYGLGDKVTLDMVDKWQLYAVAQYCDQLVSDGKGGQEPRFTCNNLYLQKSEDAFKVLKDIASIFRSTTVWTGDQFTALADIPRDPVMTFSAANAKEIIYSSVDDSAQHNLVNAQYYDKDNKFTSRVTMKRDKENILRRDKIVDVQFTAIGCTSEGQAQRAAKYLLVSELNETELVSFTTGLEGALLRLNDVFYLADDAIAGRVTSGRVVAISGANVTLDRPIPAGLALAGATKLVLNRDDISTSPVNVIAVSQDRTVVTLAAAPPATTGANLVWALITQDVVPQQFRVTDIKFNEDDLNYSISGIKYNKSKYAAIDNDARIINPPISIVENKLLKAPLTVTSTYNVRIVQDINVSDCYVAWSQSENAISYQVELQKDDDEWRIVGRFTSLATTLENLYNGVYRFRVCAIDAIGNMSQYTYSAPLTIAGKTFPPPSLVSYTVAGILFGFQHTWYFPSGVEDSRAVRIRKAILDPATNPTQPLTNFDVAYPANTYTETNVAANTVCWFSAAIVDKYGVVGAWSSWVQATVDSSPDKILDIISGHIDESTLGTALQQRLDTMGTDIDAAETLATQANTAALQAVTTATDAKNTAVDAANDAATAVTTANTAASTANTVANDLVTNVQTLTNAINNETTSRTAADADLSSRITVTENNISSVSQSVTVLSNELTTVSQGLATKADSTTVQALTNTVTQQGDQLSTNTNAITGLTSNLSTVEQQVAQKLDASAINNYYTKAETNQVAAGEVSQFKSSLTNGAIGGMNLLRASSNERSADTSTANEAYLPDYLIDTGSLQANTTYTLSGWIKGTSNVVNAELYFVHATDSTQHRFQGISVTSNYSFFKFTFTTGALENQAGFVRIDNNGSTGGTATVWAKLVKLEVGEYATAWSPSVADVASAEALTATNVNVSNLQGSVTAVSQTVTNLSATVESNNANLINNYYTKSSTDSVISAQIATFDASSSILDISSSPNPEKPNMWLLTVIEPNPSKPYNGSIIPDYALIKDAAIVERRYVAENSTYLPASYANKVLVFRTVVYASSARTINFGAFTGDDAHAIYVNRVKVFSWHGYTNHASVSFDLPQGVSVIDIMASNQTSLGGFSVQNALASQVDWMQGAESADIRSAANATAIQNIDSRVTANKNDIDAVSTSTTALTAKVGNTQSYTIVTFRNGIPASTITLPYGILDSRGVRIGTFARGMNLVVFDANGYVEYILNYDTYGIGDGALYDLNVAIQGLAAGKVFALVGLDNIGFFEVSQSVINLRNTLLTCGASASYLNQWIANNLPIFIGRKDISTGNGIENIFISDIHGGWINYGLTLINGSPVGMGALNSLTRIVDANTSATSSLTSRVTQAENNITAVSNQNTALSAELQSIPKGSGNLMLNSDFTLGNFDFWGLGTHGVPSVENQVLTGAYLAEWQAEAGMSKTAELRTIGTFNPANEYYTEAFNDVPVIANKSYQISAYTGVHRSIAYIFCLWYDSNWNLISHTHNTNDVNARNSYENNGGKFLDNYKRIYQNVTAPPNAKFMRFTVRLMAHDVSYLFFTRCQVAEISSLNTGLVAWQESTGALTYKTNQQATAISNLNATVSNIDGRVTSQASQVTTLTSAVWATRNRNYCLKPMVFNPSIVGLAGGISAFNWYNFVAIDAASGNGNWVSGLIGTTDYFAVNDGAGGAHTLSVDILYEDVGNGHAFLPPNVYFENGQGYRSLLPVDPTAPAQLNTWRRFYCVFESNGNNLVNGHFGFGGTYGRFLLRNMKIEKNPFPTPFDEGDLAKAVTITDTALTVDGIKAIKTVTVDNNGVLSGYGLVSELVNGQVQSSFGVNADTFFIGSPANNKKPFVVLTSAATINGVTVPAGTYIDTAFIADLTVTTAKINNLAVTNAKIDNLAVTNAKIADLAVTTGKIANLSVETIKIKNNAVTVPFGYIDTTVVQGKMPANRANNQEILLSSVTASGFSQYGTVQVFIQSDASFWWDNGIIQWQGSAEAKIELRDLVWNDLYADFGYAEPYEYWETDDNGIGRYIQVGRLATARRSGTLMFTVQANVNGEVKLKLLGSWTNSIKSSMQMYWSHERTSWFMQEVKK